MSDAPSSPPTAVKVDAELCLGSANCEYWAPNTFEIGDDDKSHVIDPSGDPPERLERALLGCPAKAISPA